MKKSPPLGCGWRKHKQIAWLRSLVLGLAISVTLQADDSATTVNATAAMDDATSPVLWRGLPQKGNVVADYNLAISTKQHADKPGQQRAWLKAAAREGLVTAYRRLQPDSVQPDLSRSHAVNRTKLLAQGWLQSQDPRRYTLQLASSTNRGSLQRLFADHGLVGQAQLFRDASSRDPRNPRYTLVYGSYRTARAARTVIISLPPELQQWKPWVRNFRDVQEQSLPLE